MKTSRPYPAPSRAPATWLATALLLAACAPQPGLLEPAPTRVEPPPADVLAKPGPKAADELDPALFAGLPPQARAELGLPATDDAAEPQSNRTGARPSTPRQNTSRDTSAASSGKQARRHAGTGKARSARAASARTAPARAQVRIASVAVLGVKGAPGKGNAELTRALRLVLRKAGWPVRTRAARDSMRITGRVEMGPKTPRGQRVRVKWTVKAPNGKLLGVINQNNIVPSGSLDKGFGASALPAAEGAADGIFQIVRRLQRG